MARAAEAPTRQAATPDPRLLSVVVPLYRSAETIGPLLDRLVEVLTPAFPNLEVVLVNDGSPDGGATHAAALALVERYPRVVRYFRLARNFGEHNAVMCGLRQTRGDLAAIIDDDFQNPPREILVLIAELDRGGHDVVYSRYAVKRHHWFRNLGSRFANRVASHLLGKPRDLYLSSFKVINRFLIDQVVAYEGPFPYLDGLVLRSTQAIGTALVDHKERAAGRSNYTLVRLFRLWLNMFTGFSVVPLRVATALGFVTSLFGILLGIFFIVSWATGGILTERPIPPGWASLILTVIVFGGIQLVVLGMIGEYLGRLFLADSRTPQFVVREAVEREHENQEEHALHRR